MVKWTTELEHVLMYAFISQSGSFKPDYKHAVAALNAHLGRTSKGETVTENAVMLKWGAMRKSMRCNGAGAGAAAAAGSVSPATPRKRKAKRPASDEDDGDGADDDDGRLQTPSKKQKGQRPKKATPRKHKISKEMDDFLDDDDDDC